jgi:hypothetical protein
MIDDRLAICGQFGLRVGLEGMCGGHPAVTTRTGLSDQGFSLIG